ncbi:MAG: hypothetical protein OXB95_09245 [Rhodobacteraceae bacterium]|nr:hypothetical protein [Paracoccaceae bacterium]
MKCEAFLREDEHRCSNAALTFEAVHRMLADYGGINPADGSSFHPFVKHRAEGR